MSDLDEIRSLSARYVRHLDDREPAAAAALFAEDGVWDGSGSGLDVRRGGAEILAGFERGADGPRYLHLTGNHLVTMLGEDEAEGCEHAMAVHFAETRMRLGLTLLQDRYVRTAQGWRFRSRALHRLGSAVLATEPP